MSDIAIRCEQLSKRYRIGERESYKALRDVISDAAASPFRRLRSALGRNSASSNGSSSSLITHHSSLPSEIRNPQSAIRNSFWALNHVSFDVKRGEVVGIIGRNGAGKSTLLKILSRITKPTKGRAQINGRVGSLLEVGTGFHPELSGRENIYLNAAILGMRKNEVGKKFEEIVAFAEVDKFLDTPVKRYSSGMYVRLAFAVAAHMETEVLLIDEVLAVGDAQFQKKCLGKMEEVAKVGRTVIFVSHHMPSIARLCHRAILLDRGQITFDGSAHEATSRYLMASDGRIGERTWGGADAPGDDAARLLAVSVSQDGVPRDTVDIRRPVVLQMEFANQKSRADLLCCLSLFNDQGTHLFNAADLDNGDGKYDVGTYIARFTIPGNLLSEGVVRVCAEVSTRAPVYQIHFLVFDAAAFQVIDTGEAGSVRSGWGRQIPGVLRPRIEWSIKPSVSGANSFHDSLIEPTSF